MGFSLRLAWREGRSSLRRIGIFMVSISLGVGALVAIHSFRADVDRSLEAEARALLGADFRLESTTPFSERIRGLVDSLAVEEGVEVSELTTLASMIYAPGSGATRLLQLQAVAGGFPFYGAPVSEPAGAWESLGGGVALVDPAVLVQLEAGVGDTIQIGERLFAIGGTVEGLPTEIGFQSALGPRVFIAEAELAATGLVTFGSLSRHRLFVRFPDESAARQVSAEHRELFRSESVRTRTAREEAENLSDAMGTLSRFLSLVGLAALLLGGIGVASAIHVFAKEKLTSVAVLRCIGATRREVFTAYLVQAGALGFLGAAAGVALGLIAQGLLPTLLRDVLPVEVAFTPHPGAIATGLVIGIWVSLIFALIPLLAVRDVAPLEALRAGFEPDRRGVSIDRVLAYVALAGSIVLLSLWQADTVAVGLGFAGALGGTLLVLWLVALALMGATRRFFPSRASYPIRQGVSNLFRPRNQSVAVTLALGFGAFIIGSIHVVETNLLREFRFESGENQPNVLFFDIQPDQRDRVESMVREASTGEVEVTPIVPSRIAAIGDRPIDELTADGVRGGPPRWALRRVYRHTYRAVLSDSEVLTAGEWWDVTDGSVAENRLPRISMEQDLALDLDLRVGDRITWDIEGVAVETEVASLREVDWARFQSNFFVVFEPGILDDAPQMAIALARIPEPGRRAELERDLIRAFPNVSVLDLARVQETLGTILGQISGAIRLLAGFILLGGVLVLVGTLTTSRFQRMRESALLKTLGGDRATILKVLLAEYAALGTLSGLAGFALGGLAGWFLLTQDFGMRFELPLLSLAALWIGFVLLTVVIGFANSRGVLAGTPLDTLRESAE